MAKSILIFGAGFNQITLIQAARELGLISIVIDPLCDPVGKEYADFFYCVQGSDYEKTRELALFHNVAGIVTTQMEKPMRLMAKLAQELGYIFHKPEVVEKSLNKWLMKECFKQHNVPCASGKLFNDNDLILESDLSCLTYPLIVKPTSATSSQGVFKVNSFSQIENFRLISQNFSRDKKIIIEEFLSGPEFSVESITYKGKTSIVQVTEKTITPFPRTVEMAHLQPAKLLNTKIRAITEVVNSAIKSIGIDNSAAHTEIILTSNGPKVVEIGARLGGDFISSFLVLNSCGVNMEKAAIQCAIGEQPSLIPTIKQYSFIKYVELQIGKRIKTIDSLDFLLKDNNVICYQLAIKPNELVQEITESSKRHGFIIVKGKSKNEVLQQGKYYTNIIIKAIKYFD